MLREDEQFVFDYIEEMGGMDEVTESVASIKSYREQEWYDSKAAILQEWQIGEQDIYELVISIFCVCLQNEEVTMQCMVGMLNHKVKVADELDRIKVIADIIGLVSLTGLIDIESEQGEYHMVSTEYEIEDAFMPVIDKHIVWITPPPLRKSNFDKEDGRGSAILGHKMNQHDEFINLNHLNRISQVPLTINTKFIAEYEPIPKEEPEGEEEESAWEDFKMNMLSKIDYIVENGNVFYEDPAEDFRGRTYIKKGHYISHQGTSFQKAAIELYNKELVIGD